MPTILDSQLLRLPKRIVLPPDQSYLPDLPGLISGEFTDIGGPTKWNDQALNVTGSRLLRDHSKGPICWTEKSFNNFMHGTFFPDRNGQIFRLSARGFGRPGSMLRRPRVVMVNSASFDVWNSGPDDQLAWRQIIDRMKSRFDKHGIDFMGQFGSWPGLVLGGMPAKDTIPFDKFTVNNAFYIGDTLTVQGGTKRVRAFSEFPEILGGDLLVITASGGFDSYSVLDYNDNGPEEPITFFRTLFSDPLEQDKSMVEEGLALFGSYKNFVQIILPPSTEGGLPGIYDAIMEDLPEENYEIHVHENNDIFDELPSIVDEAEQKIVEFFHIPEDEDG